MAFLGIPSFSQVYKKVLIGFCENSSSKYFIFPNISRNGSRTG